MKAAVRDRKRLKGILSRPAKKRTASEQRFLSRQYARQVRGCLKIIR